MKLDPSKKQYLKEIDLNVKMDSGAPCPYIIKNEYKLYLMFYIDMPDPNWDGTYVNVRDNARDKGIACISFNNYCQIIDGWPNDEVLIGHRYYEFGLKSYRFFEVIHSDWIMDILNRNRKHPNHNDSLFEDDKHYIFCFHDTCFEIITNGYKVDVFNDKSMKDVCEMVINKMF
ncbi:MAG: hypothetical protein JW915_09175 [Chitinispirillaceae bacterium]|nr:hypothetical protein [Chitinispirillaceae bacterium]